MFQMLVNGKTSCSPAGERTSATRLQTIKGLMLIALLLLIVNPAQAVIEETVNGSITTGTSLVLPSWTPGSNDLILVGVALRDETQTVSLSGNGLTFVEVSSTDNVLNECGLHLFRAMGASPSTGSITVTISGGNTLPVVASATRISGADQTGSNGSGAIEFIGVDPGNNPSDDDMQTTILTSTNTAWAWGVGTHRSTTFSVPTGEIGVSINNTAGTGADETSISSWYEEVPTAGIATVGAAADLDANTDWAMICVSIKPLSDGSLPVELSSFTAQAIDGEVMLEWVTSSEVNNDIFIVERSTDLESFTTLTEISGQGNTSQTTHYSYSDRTVQAGETYYYRLADRDFSGNVTRHKVITVMIENGATTEPTGAEVQSFRLMPNFPNPFNPETTIQYELSATRFAQGPALLRIINISGQVVRTYEIEAPESGTETGSLKWDGKNEFGINQPSGLYLIELRHGLLRDTQKAILAR